jgi:O-succinylbenzoic acid--CoA ligase
MEQNILSQLKIVAPQWHFHDSTDNFFSLVDYYQQQIKEQIKLTKTPIIFLAERESDRFIAAFFASVINDVCLFLINPNWQQNEWQQVENIVQPDLIFGQINYRFKECDRDLPRCTGIMIPTGGTSGQIKFAIHTWQTLTSSAQGFYRFFGSLPLNFYDCLPLYHVSGLMPVIRSFLSRGKLIIKPFSFLKNNWNISDNYQDYFISFVPTQLQYFLETNPLYLTKFKIILVGGSATHSQQISLAKKYHIPLALTYGMTETASGISILKPAELRETNNSNGQLLPHAQIIIDSKNQAVIKIKSSSLFQGYYPHRQAIDFFTTDDVGYVDNQGYLYLLGRNSQKIITGGENVFPLEIETAILATGLVKDIYIVGEKDNYWGEIITAFYVPNNQEITYQQIEEQLRKNLSNYKIPKKWYKLEQIPRNQQGKSKLNIIRDC